MNRTKFFASASKLLLIIGLILSAGLMSSCKCDRDKKEFDREVSDSKLDSLSFIKLVVNRDEKDLFDIPVDSLSEG